ncbi:hypothetical protein C6499_01530 [Candidatus Poribacteria bacterium]|nr:MAG: hypothetical protein C6499_01530 [Candidatus Poribacteria bacterium]
MKMIKLIGPMLLLTLVVFLVNGFAGGLPKHAITRIDTGKGPVNAIAYAQSANQLAIAAANNIHIHDADTYKERMVLAGHTDSVLAVAFSFNGKLIVSGSADKTVRLWEAETGKLRRAREEHTAPVNIVAFSLEGERFWSASRENNMLRSWYSRDGGRWSTKTSVSDDTVITTAFSQYGEIFAEAVELPMAVKDKFKFAVFSSEIDPYKEFEAILTKHREKIVALTISPSSEFIATGSSDWTIEVWKITDTEPLRMDMDLGDPLWILKGHAGTVTSVAFSPSGKILASGSADQRVRLWDLTTGKLLHTFSNHTSKISALAFARDDVLVSGSSDGTVFIWNLNKIVPTD